jgi:predicted RNA-binding Zn-ribbon protein involved in translation (DUF1610 family)
MAVLTVRTVRVAGSGAVTCRFCDRSTTFENSEWLEFIDDGTTLACVGVHEGLVILHDCRRPSMVWQCPQCGLRPPVRLKGRRGHRQRLDRRCPNCGDLVVQVRDDGPPPD